MSILNEFKTALNELIRKYWFSSLSVSVAIAILITNIFSIKFLGKVDIYYLFEALFLFLITTFIIFLILNVIALCFYYKFKFIPIKINNRNYKLIIRLLIKNEQLSEDQLPEEQSPERSIVMDTSNLLINDDTTARYTFELKISDYIKKKLKGKRFSIVFYKPATIKLSINKRKSLWDQQFELSPDKQYFCLDQNYEGSSNHLKFSLKINSESFDANTQIEIFFEYGSKIEIIKNGNYKPSNNAIYCEKVYYMRVDVTDPSSKEINPLIT